MANTHRGERHLDLVVPYLNGDGTPKSFTVRLTYNGAAEAERHFNPQGDGQPSGATDVVRRMATGRVYFADIRALLWAACRGQHGLATVDDAGEILGANMESMPKIGEAMLSSLIDLFPQAMQAEQPEKKAGETEGN